MTFFLPFILLLFISHVLLQIEAACSSCLVSSLLKVGGSSYHAHTYFNTHGGRRYKYAQTKGVIGSLGGRGIQFYVQFLSSLSSSMSKSTLIYIAFRQLSTHFGHDVLQLSSTTTTSSIRHRDHYYLQNLYSTRRQKRENKFHLLSSNDKDKREDANDNQNEEENTKDEAKSNVMSASMISTIGIYKNFISPLLPPACRFLPTCSQYGVQAIEQFGPEKGCILIAWRLLRCSPFGGRGYDPPKVSTRNIIDFNILGSDSR